MEGKDGGDDCHQVWKLPPGMEVKFKAMMHSPIIQPSNDDDVPFFPDVPPTFDVDGVRICPPGFVRIWRKSSDYYPELELNAPMGVPVLTDLIERFRPEQGITLDIVPQMQIGQLSWEVNGYTWRPVHATSTLEAHMVRWLDFLCVVPDPPVDPLTSEHFEKTA